VRWLGVVPGWLTLTALFSAGLPSIAKAILVAIVGATACDPAEGFLLTAGLLPLGGLLATLFDVQAFRLTEAMALAFMATWLLRGGWRPGGPTMPSSASRAAWLLAALVVASVGALGWRFWRGSGPLPAILEQLANGYFVATDPFGAIESAKLLEGFGLLGAAIVLFRTRPVMAVHVPVALAASAVAASIASLLVWRGFGPPSLLQEYARTGYRVAAHVSDVNAAGSYFVLVFGATCGMAIRERGLPRLVWIVASAITACGLWLSESRSALAAAVAASLFVGVWVVTTRFRPSARIAAVAIVGALLAVGGWTRLVRLERDATYQGAGLRTQFAQTSLRMIAERPVYGIGAGRYHPESNLFLSPRLAWTYGFENAHNYFLQIAGETGLLGLVLFAAILAGGLTLTVRVLSRTPHDWRLAGMLVGVVGFLATCLSGHPLLVREVAFPFWIQFGLMVALASSTLLNLDAAPLRAFRGFLPRRSIGTLAVVALVVAVVPARLMERPLEPSSAPGADGFYEWETGSDGVRFRWTTAFASLFVPSTAIRVDIPVRAPREGGRFNPSSVEIAIGGVNRGRFAAADEWSAISLPVADGPSVSNYKRIDLRVDRTWRPAVIVPGSAEMRAVGIQVGMPIVTATEQRSSIVN
jgi:O-antigen ligase